MADPSGTDTRAVAIIGMAGRFPGAPDLDAFWRNLRDGEESISRFSDQALRAAGVDPADLADPAYVKANGMLDGVELFDAGFFGMTPLEAQITDPQHRVFLECAWQVLEDAGCDSERFEGRIGVFAGAGFSTYLIHHLLRCHDLESRVSAVQLSIGNNKDYVPTRVSYKLNLKGPSVNVNTACSSALVAVHLACQSLLDYHADVVLAGGVGIQVPQHVGYRYHSGGIASPDGRCRPFDAAAQGTVSGNGVGIVVLKRLEDALADGDSIRAVILGSAVNNDGAAKVGYTAPSVDGQASVIAEAHAVAGIDPATIQYVEAHGTGTAVGDPIEIAALTQAFRLKTDREAFCAIGSVKSNIGHLDEAAGAAGLIKTVLALQHAEIPPSLHFERPNPEIDFARSPFVVNASLREWRSGGPRRAGVSAFGIGGTNAHLIVEQAPPVAARTSSASPQLLTLSARTAGALERASRALADHLERHTEVALSDVAWTLQEGRRRFDHRHAVAVTDLAGAVVCLRSGTRPAVAVDAPRIVFLFPGQGAQYAGMGRGLYDAEPEFRADLDRCAESVKARLGFDLRDVLYRDGRDADLRRTLMAQPAVFAVEYALARLWMSWGIAPHGMLGHSLGEYVAATMAGVFSLEAALDAICSRAELMDSLPGGAMVSVPLGEADVTPLLAAGLALAAVNAPGRTVVSGSADDVAAFSARLLARGVDSRPLETSHAFHSRAMDPIVDEFARRLARLNLRAPARSWISNVTGQPISPADAVDPRYWARHLRQPVQFSGGARTLLHDQGTLFLEVGPGRTLTTLLRQQVGWSPDRVAVQSLRHPEEPGDDCARLLDALGRLWMRGVAPDWRAVHRGEPRRRIPLPTYPFDRQRYWIEPDAADVAQTVKSSADVVQAVRPARHDAVSSWFYLPSWKRTLPPRVLAPAMAVRTLVLGDSNGLAEALRQAGCEDVTVVASDAWRDALALLGDGRPLRVVDCTTLREAPLAPDGGGRDDFEHVLALCQALARRSGPNEIVVVTEGVEDVTGGETIHPSRALLAGPLMVLPQERPDSHARLVDVTGWRRRGAPPLVAQLVEEIAGGQERLVAWREGRRWVRVFEPVSVDEPTSPAKLRDEGVYLITGGLGGVGLILAEYLSDTFRAKLALLGRSAAAFERALAEKSATDPSGSLALAWIGDIVKDAEREATTSGLEAFPGLESSINRLCSCYIVELLSASGQSTTAGSAFDVADVARGLKITRAFRPMCDYFAHVLVEDGILEREGGRFRWTPAVADLPDARHLRGRLLREYPQFAGMFDLLEHCVSQYAPALSGSIPAISVLYPDGEARLLEEAASRTVAYSRRAVYTQAVRDVVARLCTQLGRRVRILEIGVGDGLLAGVVAPALKGLDVEYHATDLGRTFVARAEQAASAAGLRFMRFGLLDIGNPPGPQGYEPGSFDVVLALDVLHATPDIRRTVGHVRELVAPGGIAAVIETVHAPRWVNMIWGLAEGWWSFTDADRREHSPLMPVTRWADVFGACGFERVTAWDADGRSDYGLILVEAGGTLTMAGLDARESHQVRVVRRLRRRGADLMLLAADVADETAMRQAIADTVARFGRIDGVIHAAGETRREIIFNPLETTGAAEVDAVFRPKVTGTQVLADLLSGVRADFVLLLSSNASVLGGLGLSAYAAASRYLDAFAAARRHAGDGRWVSTNWDGWPTEQTAGTGVQFQTSIDRYAMSLPECRSAFARAMSVDAPQIVVSAGDLQSRLRRWQERRPAAEDVPVVREADALAHERPEISTSFDAPTTHTERVLAGIWEELLGIRPVGVNDGFAELGGDSLLGTQLIARVDRALSCRMPFRSLFEEPTVRLQAKRIDSLRAATVGPTDEIAPLPAGASYSLSHAQRRLWVLSQLDGSAAYNIPLHQMLDGPLDVEALEGALSRLVARHETLRTSIVMEDGEPRQRVDTPDRARLSVVDVSAEADPEAVARGIVRQSAAEPFDLAATPLHRVSLLRLGAERHVLLFTIHHIVCDGVSIAVLVRDLAALYRASARKDLAELPALGVQYRDYAAWQNRALDAGVLASSRDYWLRALSGPLTALDLPRDFPRPDAQTFRGAEHSWLLPSDVTIRLSDVARTHRVSLFMFLTGVVKVLLHRYTGQEDIIIGTPTAGRTVPELSNQIGCYLNMLALRDRIQPSMRFADVLDSVRDTATGAYDHQAYPFDRLVDELNLPRDRSRSPVFDVIVILQNQQEALLQLDGLAARPFFDHNGTSKADLTFNFKESAAGLAMGIEFNTDLFRPDRVARMGGHFQHLLEALIQDPAATIGSIDVRGDDERAQVARANDTRREYPVHLTLPELVHQTAQRSPGVVAVQCGTEQLTYGDLDLRAKSVAGLLRSRGIGRGDRVGIYLDRSTDMVAASLGVQTVGAAYVPLDPAFPVDRLRFMAEDAGLALVFGGSRFESLGARAPVVHLADELQNGKGPTGDTVVSAEPDDVAYVIYTSGSTGRPKGVAVEQRALVNLLWSMRHEPGFAVGDTLLAVTTLSFDIAALELFLPLVCGGCVSIATREEAVSGAALAALLRQTGATVMQATPATWQMMLEAGWTGDARLTVLCGGEALPFSLARRLASTCRRVWNMYGPTETTIWSSVLDASALVARTAGETAPDSAIPIGRPIANTELHVLDRSLRPVPVGVPGELYIGGDGLARGYFQRPELTAERFVVDPFSATAGRRLYRTGDLVARRSDGDLDFHGRLDDQIKLRGFRIEIGEIENALLQHPAIGQAAVVVVSSSTGPRLQAAVVARAFPGEQGDAVGDALHIHLRRSLPEYMVPATFIVLDDLPRTPNGKIDRRALRQMQGPIAGERGRGPSLPLEHMLCVLFEDVLKAKVDSTTASFFDLGGHSLTGARLAFRIEQDLGVRVSFADVFAHPTVDALARIVEARRAGAAGPESIAPMTPEELEMLSD